MMPMKYRFGSVTANRHEKAQYTKNKTHVTLEWRTARLPGPLQAPRPACGVTDRTLTPRATRLFWPVDAQQQAVVHELLLLQELRHNITITRVTCMHTPHRNVAVDPLNQRVAELPNAQPYPALLEVVVLRTGWAATASRAGLQSP